MWNAVSSWGAYISFAAALFFVFGVFYTLFFGKKAADNPWGDGATTLEWTLTSPPPFHQFTEMPVFEDKTAH
jgi:cytochrome c oxidase subunit I